ncbi:MAG: glycosyltransferase [Candidatus Eisenbacteria bacterium]|nr:glycosyltransferase [Candidatus Eisenbacteria bacterium]
MRIVMASAEVAPFARAGGLSDVVGALSQAMAEMGHEVTVFLPKYALIDDEEYGIEPVESTGPVAVPMGTGEEEVRLYESRMPDGGAVRVVFINHRGYFDRLGLYIDPDTGHGYPDEVERYALFSRAVLESSRALDLRPDVFHLNDHHTALAAVYLREFYSGDPGIGGAGIVFSIHNLGYLGWFEKSVLPALGFSEDRCVFGSPFEYKGGVSTLKLGIEHADYVNTVSEQYAIEISTSPEYGLGLEGVLAERRKAGRLLGILNGVDYRAWDPGVDDLIPAKYSEEDLSGKEECKRALLERSGLPMDTAPPLIGMVSRLADQKGFDLLREAGDRVVELGARLVVLGTGQKEYHDFLEGLSNKRPESVAAHLTFDNELAHWIEAGSDMFLMPSRYEPCGLNQLYSLRYGTVPVVRATGGLADTVEDYDEERETGVGFVFEEYSEGAMLGAIERALRAYGRSEAWRGIVRRGMALDFSWAVSAGKYATLYEKARLAAGSRAAA